MAALLAGMSQSAWAQAASGTPDPVDAGRPVTLPLSESSTSAEAAASSSDSGEITVTGSRIVRRDYESNSPIATLGSQTLANLGAPTLPAALSRIPQVSPSGGGLNLRGLGSARTLTLMDGRRLPSSDINIIPQALVENIEIITGGASAVYGSDAVAGVVNFMLKKNFSGVQASFTKGWNTSGKGPDLDGSLTFGGNFADGRGNAVISFEAYHRDGSLLTDRDWSVGSFRQSSLPEGEVSFGSNAPTQVALNQVFGSYGVAAGAVKVGSRVAINPDNTLYSNGLGIFNRKPYPSSPDELGSYFVNGNAILYDTRAFRTLQPSFTRKNAFGRITYELTDNVTAFAQFLFARNNSLSWGNPTPASGAAALTVSASNIFIPADLKTLLNSRAQPNATFSLGKSTDELGARGTYQTDTVYQVTTGLSGKLPIKDWTWNSSATFGQVDSSTIYTNYPSLPAIGNLLLAADGGQSLCAGGYNPFGYTKLSPACRAYISRRLHSLTGNKQYIAEANVQGLLFKLPAGELRFAAGLDYRRDSVTNDPDGQIAANNIPFLAGTTASGSDDVKEAYGELSIPILHDTFLVKKLELDLGYRYSDYKHIGGVSTYKADATWEINSFLRLRGGYERAIRSPSVVQLTAPTRKDFDRNFGVPPTNGDPCDIRTTSRSGSDGAKVAALCSAQGIPAALIANYQVGSVTFPITTGGNPDLGPEKADTYSLGAVIRSPFASPILSGLSASVDYYNISLKGAIGTVTAPQVVALCFNRNGGSNPGYDAGNSYCQQIRRDPGTGDIVNVDVLVYNLGGYKTSGIDFQVDWRFGLADLGISGDPGKLVFKGIATRLLTYTLQNRPGDPWLEYAGTIGNAQVENGGTTKPRWRVLGSVNYLIGPINVGGTWRYVGPQSASSNVGTTGTALGVKTRNYFDASLNAEVTRKVSVFANVTNLGNLKPPVYPIGSGSVDGATYDLMGRRIAVGATVHF